MSKFSSMAGGFTGLGSRVTSVPKLVVVGGNTSFANGYKYHFFGSSGQFNVTNLPIAGTTVSVLIVAGGGGGGAWSTGASGGGGAGGVLEINNINLTTQAYTITVGAAGAQQGQGGNSVAFSYTAIGGGRGDAQGPSAVGGNGGSGGAPGSYASYSINTNTPGRGVYPGSTYIDAPRQGYDSTVGFSYNWGGSGAGGGAGSYSANPGGLSGSNGAAGGNGDYSANFAQFGDDLNLGYFASGGSAYWDGGYGNISSQRVPGGGGFVGNTTGKINTGGGGGGPINGLGSTGGSGVVIIRYPATGL